MLTAPFPFCHNIRVRITWSSLLLDMRTLASWRKAPFKQRLFCFHFHMIFYSWCFSDIAWGFHVSCCHLMVKKGKGFPYSTLSVGPGADPGAQAVSLQVTVSHPPGGRLPLLSARPAVTSPATEHHRPLPGTKLYCLVTEAHRCKQLA